MKKFLTLLFIAAVFISLTFFAFSSKAPEPKSPDAAQTQYQIGDKLSDSGGSIWEYRGKAHFEVGQLTKDCKLLTVLGCGKEVVVLGIHPETIPFAQLNDYFRLIEPSAEYAAYLLERDGVAFSKVREECNWTVADPPIALPDISRGGLCCLRLACGDLP